MTPAPDPVGTEPSAAERRRIRRNLILFTIGVLGLSAVAGALSSGGAEVGGLVFILSPILMAVVLRTLGRDGWADAGLRLGSLRWYAFAVLAFPLTIAVLLGLGVLTGSIVFQGTPAGLLGTAAAGLAQWLIFAAFEEWGWRGYLEPRLARIGLPDLKRHLLVGLIWGVWHIPYILGTPGYTALPAGTFAALLAGSMLAMAVVYGQLRKASGTVWTAVLLHGIGNALAQPLVLGGLAEFRQPALIATRPENLAFIIIWAGLGWMLMRRSARQGGPASS